MYFDLAKDNKALSSIHTQLEAFRGLVKAGKSRAIGLSNESPYGVHEFVLARANGMTPTQMALAFCYTKWPVASTIIGVTSVAQLDENMAAWDTNLSPEVLTEIDNIRREMRDPGL